MYKTYINHSYQISISKDMIIERNQTLITSRNSKFRTNTEQCASANYHLHPLLHLIRRYNNHHVQ
jgi:hypothetical protein